MYEALLLLILPLASALLTDRIAFSLFLIVTFLYSVENNVEIRIRNVDEKTSYFNTFLLATVLSAISCISLPREIVYASVFSITAHEIRKRSLWNILTFTILSFVYFIYFYYVNSYPFDFVQVLFLSLAGGLSASIVECVETDADKRVTLLLAMATTFTIFKIYVPSASIESLAIAFTISFFISLLALKLRVADESGLMSATLVGTILILFTDIRFFTLILLFYIIGSISSRYKYSSKEVLGLAEYGRGYANVFGNSLAPLFFALQYSVTKNEFFLLAFVSSVATALGDTMASEIGKTAKNVYLITNFKRVKAGTSGGISLIGEVSAIIGALIISISGFLLKMINLYQVVIVTLSAFIAIHVDSVLGATLEERGYLTNSAVNALATLSAGLFCYVFLLFM